MADLITGGAQGSERINDIIYHNLSTTPVAQVEILEDDTDFVTVHMQTRDNATPENTQAWGVSQQIAGTTTPPIFGTGHVKGEFISTLIDTQRITGIRLSAGSIRIYFA